MAKFIEKPPTMDPELNPEASQDQDALAAFNAAFEGEDGTEKPPQPGEDNVIVPGDDPRTEKEVAAPAPAPAVASPAPAPEVDPAADPFASLPPQVKEVLALVPTLAHDLKTTVGRVAALQRENETLRRAQAAQTTAATPAPAPAEPQELDEVRAVREQGLPEVADAIQAAVKSAMKKNEPAPAASPPASAPASPEPAAGGGDDDELNAEAAALASLQPDWAPKMNSADFKLWLHSQGDDYKTRVLTTTRGIVVADALGKFDKHQAQASEAAARAMGLADKRNARVAGAVTPAKGAPPNRTAPADDEQSAFLQGFNEG